MKDNIFRVIYVIICAIISVFGVYFYDDISSNFNTLQQLSYIGLIITLIGFIVTIFEVVHSVYVSKSINSQSQLLLEKVKDIENASTISDCLSAVDDTNRYVMAENYFSALITFQHLRKVLVKLKLATPPDSTLLNKVEQLLHKATKVNPLTPLSKPQKSALMKDILTIKVTLEQANPVNRRTSCCR